MPRTFADAMAYDAQYVACNANEFAETLTLYHYSASALTANQLLSLMGYPPLPDGDIDASDRRQLLGLYRFGDLATTSEEVDVQFFEDGLDGLQGLSLDDASGRRVTEMATVELPATVSVVCDESPEKCDYFLRDGVRWNCLRISGRDPAMQAIEVRRDTKVTTKGPRPRP